MVDAGIHAPGHDPVKPASSAPVGGPLLAVAAVVAGVLIGTWRGPAAATTVLAAGAALVVTATLVKRRALPVALCGLACLGVASMQRALDGLEHSALTEPVELRSRGTITGELAADPTVRWYSAQVRVRVASAVVGGRHLGVDRLVLVRATGPVAMRLGVLEAGDRVTLDGGFEPLEGWDRRERWRHVVGMFRADRLLRFAPPRGVLWRAANELRRRVLAGLAPLPAHERALASSYLLGDDRGIPRRTIDEFRAAGMTHLLVVSGLNVSFMLALCGPLLRRLGLGSRFVLAVGVLVVFGTMTRWEPSVLRAVVMNGLVMTAVLVGRPSSGLRVLAMAAAALLLVDPFLLRSVGFLLSCSATAGIAVLARPVADRLRGPRWAREAFATALAAEIGVAPVLIAVFGHVPLASVPANVLATPPSGVVKLGGLVAGPVGGVLDRWFPEAAALLVLPLHAVLVYERAIAAAAARTPFELTIGPLAMIAAAVGLALLLARARRLRSASPPAP